MLSRPRNPYTWPLIGAIYNFVCVLAWFVLMVWAAAHGDWTQAIFWLLTLVFTNDHMAKRSANKPSSSGAGESRG